MAQAPREYEEFVRDVCQALLDTQGLETVRVQHDVQLPGLSRTHQVDVYWEYRLGGVHHRVIINCKLYQSTVQVNDVLVMKGVLADFPSAVGLIVTTVGFQKGAVDFARTHAVGLKVIRPPTAEDYGDKLRGIRLQFLPRPIIPTAFATGFDRPWLAAHCSEADAARWLGTLAVSGNEVVEDRAGGRTATLDQLFREAVIADRARTGPMVPGDHRNHTYRFADAYLHHAPLGVARLTELAFAWTMTEGAPVVREVRFDYAAIVRDAVEGTLLFVDEAGAVSGDVEAAAPRLTKPSA